MANHAHTTRAPENTPPDDEPTTAEDYATLEFEAMTPGLHKELGTLDQWLEEARNQFPIMVMATAMLEQDHHGLARIAAAEPDASAELADCIVSLRDRLRGHVTLLNAALVRAIAGLSRHAAAVGEL